MMELMIGGSLTDVLGPKIDFKEAHIAYVAKATLQALAYMHQSYRMHRDIKSDNVLVCMYMTNPYILLSSLTSPPAAAYIHPHTIIGG